MSQLLAKSNFTIKVKVAKSAGGDLVAVELNALLDNSPKNGPDCHFISP